MSERSQRTPPQLLGYQIEELLGSGPLGDVYLAQKTLRRDVRGKVVLKVLRDPYKASSTDVGRAFMEVRDRVNRALDALQADTEQRPHAELVGVMAVERTPGDLPVLVLSPCPIGQTLEAWYEHRSVPLPVEDCLRSIWKLAWTLNKISGGREAGQGDLPGHGLLHPANILRCFPESGSSSDLMILDYGMWEVWRTLNRQSSPSLAVAPERACYLAPEQFNNYGPATAEGDVYSLGALLHFLLYRAPPTSKLRPQTAAGVPREVERLLHQMLDVRPEARPKLYVVLNSLQTAMRGGSQPAAAGAVPYKIRDLVCNGSDWVLYEAEEEATQQRGFLRVLDEGFSTERLKQFQDAIALQNEVAALPGTQLDGLLAVKDQGLLPDGKHYVFSQTAGAVPLARVLRYRCRRGLGEPLQTIVEHFGRLDSVLAAAEDLSGLLAAAHRHSVLHLRVDPWSVLLEWDQSVSVLRTRLLMSDVAVRCQVRATAVAASAPPPASPEQAAFRPPEWDKSTNVSDSADVYSLGLLLWLLIYGKLPQGSERFGDPVTWQESDNAITHELQNLLQALLAPDPTHRLAMETARQRLRWLRCLLRLAHGEVLDDKYQIQERIGGGAMGIIYRAVHTDAQLQVALKVPLPEFSADPRIRQEVAALIKASHQGNPHVVRIYSDGPGKLPDGSLYFAMEFLKGETLGARLRRLEGRLIEKDAVAICRDIASGLVVAHKHGVIHRDLKPDNVMLAEDPQHPGRETVKVFDFGIAKVWSATPLTKANTMMGTLKYMAPEQYGQADRATDRADVYALGVILYELLGNPERPTTEVIAKHVQNLRLSSLIQKMTALRPEDRPSMQKVEQELSVKPKDSRRAVRGGILLSLLGIAAVALYSWERGPVVQQRPARGSGTDRPATPPPPVPLPTPAPVGAGAAGSVPGGPAPLPPSPPVAPTPKDHRQQPEPVVHGAPPELRPEPRKDPKPTKCPKKRVEKACVKGPPQGPALTSALVRLVIHSASRAHLKVCAKDKISLDLEGNMYRETSLFSNKVAEFRAWLNNGVAKERIAVLPRQITILCGE